MKNLDTSPKWALGWFLLCVAAFGLFGVLLALTNKDWFDVISKTSQVVAWFAAVAVGAFGVWKHFDESREKRKWEKAKLAKEMLDDLNANPLALNATYMLGAWDGRWYERPEDGQVAKFQVTQDQLAQVLEPSRAAASKNESYVRDCYDNFLFHLELCFAAVESELIDSHALEPMLLPLFAGVDRVRVLPKLKAYAAFVGYHRTEARLSELAEAALTKPRT